MNEAKLSTRTDIETERFYVSKLRGKSRLYRKWLDEEGKWHNQVLPVTEEDLSTAEGVERAKLIWKNELVRYPCSWCGKSIEMTRDEIRFFAVHMLKRYRIGALPTCSKECAKELVAHYEKKTKTE